MQRLIEFSTSDGRTILVEVSETEGGPRPAGAGSGAIERATMGLDQAISKVRPVAESLLTELEALSRRPDQVSVEFGIKFNVTAGVVIANTAMEGNCKITIGWKSTG